MAKILITGIHGFVGSNLVEALKANNTIYGLDIVAPEKDGVEKTYSWGDLENGSIPDVDAIIHLAAETGTGQSMYEIQKYTDTNIGGTALLLDLLTNTKQRNSFSSVPSRRP